jgi:hypothetical protein
VLLFIDMPQKYYQLQMVLLGGASRKRNRGRQSERRMPEDPPGSGVFRQLASVVPCILEVSATAFADSKVSLRQLLRYHHNTRYS